MIALLVASAWGGETVLVPRGGSWSYLDTGVDPGAGWNHPAFDDSAWSTGVAPLGYGIVGVATTVDSGPDPLARHPTTWFRTTFELPDPGDFEAFSLALRRDDGAAVYVNGVEVMRDNLAVGATATTYATLGVYGLDQDAFALRVVPSTVLVRGTNTVAVELHNQAPNSPDLVLDLGLSGWDGPTDVIRGPWLQQLGPDGAIVRWRTDGPGQGQLWWGPAPGALTEALVDPVLAFDHELRITGCPDDTDVAYAVGHPTAGVLAGDDADHVFHTAPAPGTRRPVRIWALGDSGTANANAAAVRDAYRALAPDPLQTDLWLMLGDNAYGSGRESEYQTAVFDFYPEWLRQTSLWATLGNHDGYSAFSATQTGPYFDLFTFPTQGEVGGEPSGTEAYWSFDYANLHVVDLDSMHSDRSPTGAMAMWLDADLSASTADWNVVMFHHPPYSKGSHDSDRERELVEMREGLVPILEAHGVDLVLSGHSHSYERSWLLDGHYDTSDTFTSDAIVQDQSGDPSFDAAYTKWRVGTGDHDGTVYVVAGSSGQVSGGSLDHPAMLVSLPVLGSMVIDVNGLVMRGRFLDSAAGTQDVFEIHKGVTTIDDLGGDRLGLENQVLSFHVSATQPDGDPVTDFRWNWGDGTPDGRGATPTHAWTTEGLFAVTVSGTDDRGVVVSDTWSVNIDNGTPAITSAGWTGVSLEGSPITLSAVAEDPGLDPLTYTWTIEGQEQYGSTVLHTFYQDGTYRAHLDVRDDAGRSDQTDVDLVIGNAAPALLATDFGVPVEGARATLEVTVDDPGFDYVSVEWEVDGQRGTGLALTHTFADDGRYPVHLTLRDDGGAVVEEARSVHVENAPPTVSATRSRGAEGEAIRFEATTADPGASDTVQVRWAFGDGTVGQGRVVHHVFPDQGPWAVRATARDDGGATTVATLTTALENLPPSVSGVEMPAAVTEGRRTPLRVIATDPGLDDVLGAEWSIGAGVALSGLEVTAVWPDEGTWDGSVTVTDDEGLGVSWPFSVAVANAPPVFSPPPVSRVAPGDTFAWTVDVQDVDPLALTLLEGPDGAALAGTALRWTAPDAPGLEAAFHLRAEDGDGGTADLAFTVVVAALDAAPEHRLAPAGPDGCAHTRGAPAGAATLTLLAALRRGRRRRSAR